MSKLLTILLSIIGLMGAIGFYRLPSDWVTPSFQKALSETIGPHQLDLPKVQIGWGGWRHPLGINIQQVTIVKPDQDLKLQIPDLLLSIRFIPLLLGKAEIGKCIFNSAKIYKKDQLLGEISAKIKISNKKYSLKVDFQNLNATGLLHIFLKHDLPPQASYPFQGTFLLEGGRNGDVNHVDLNCFSRGGVLVIPHIYPNPLNLNKTNFSIKGNSQKLTINKINIEQGSSLLNVRGSLLSPIPWRQAYESGAMMDLSLEGKVKAVPVDNLKFLWPHGLSPKPRKWVVNQLSKGKADEATALLHGRITLAPNLLVKRFEIPQIEGQILASDVTVDYFGKLPPATNVNGKCTFTREKFFIDAVGQAHNIQMKSAHIVIHDLHVKDQTIDIDLDLQGGVRNSLEIINAQPLLLASKLDLDPSRISGHSTTKVHLNFPLETVVPLEMIKVDAKSHIEDGKIQYEAKVDGKPIVLNRGTFDLNVSQKALDMKGCAYIHDVLTQIQWQEFFLDQGIPFRRQFHIKGDFDLKKLSNFGLITEDYLDGHALGNVKYRVNTDLHSELEIFLDMTPSIMVSPVLFWQKDKEESAHLKILIRKDNPQQSFWLDEATLIAPKLNFIMKGTHQDPRRWEIQRLQMGSSLLRSTIQQKNDGTYQVSVYGKVLDLAHILDDTTPDPLIKPTSKDIDSEIQTKLELHLDDVSLGKNNSIHNVKGELLYHGNTLSWANLKGKPPHNDGQISLQISPLINKQQQFRLHSDDGGHLLEMLGADYNLEGGSLTISGTKVEKYLSEEQAKKIGHRKSWEIKGDISIDDFTINKAPLLARLLAATSFQNIINFVSGRGIHFHSGQAQFILTPAIAKIDKMRLMSPSLGLLLSGSIDRLHHQVNFSGELIPLYLINTLLARIPILGTWISGGNEDGVFMTYFTLTGDRRDPTLAINPITTVTPGLVREMFKPQEMNH